MKFHRILWFTLFLSLACSKHETDLRTASKDNSSTMAGMSASAVDAIIAKLKAKASTFQKPTRISQAKGVTPVKQTPASVKEFSKLREREALLWARDQLAVESLQPFGRIAKIPGLDKKVLRQLSVPSTKSSRSVIKNTRAAGPGGNYNEYFVSDSLSFTSTDYVDNMSNVFWGDFTAPSNASYVYLNFNSFDIESYYDHVYVVDANGNQCDSLTGSLSSGVTSHYCNGRYAAVYIDTDSSRSGDYGYSGFEISGYTYGVPYDPPPPPNHPPVAIAVADQYSKPDGASFSFVGSQSYDNDANDYVYAYEWDFGDGYTSTYSNAYHTYSQPGTYYVTLTVWDTHGASSEDTLIVTVRPAPAPISFAVSSTEARKILLAWQSGGSDTSGFIFNKSLGYAPYLTCEGGSNLGYSMSRLETGLQPDTYYTFALCAYNSYNKISSSVRLYVSTTPIVYPPPPHSFIVRSIFANRFYLDWSSGGGNTDHFHTSISTNANPPPCSQGDSVSSPGNWFTGLHELTTYYVRTCAANEDEDLSNGVIYSVTTPQAPPPPPAIANLAVTNIGTNSVALQWASGGGSTYGFAIAVAKSATAHPCSSANLWAGSDTNYTVTGLDSNSLYSFTVCAENNVWVQGPASSIQALTLDPTPAPNPVGLAIAFRTETSLTLAWQSGGGTTTGFLLKSAAGTTAPANCTGGVALASPGYVLSGLNANSNYAIRVCAVNKIGVANGGVTITGSTTDYTPIEVSDFAMSTRTSSSITMTWSYTGLNVAGGFLMKRATGTTAPADCSSGTAVALSARTYTSSSLTANTTYTYRICSKNGNGITTPGATLTVRTLQTPPPNPTLATSSSTDSSVTARWTSGGGSTATYKIALASGATAPSNCNTGTSVSALTYTFTGLNAYATYSFRVCAVNADGAVSSGVTGSKATLDHAPIPVTNLQAVNRTSSSFSLTWDYAGTNIGGGFLLKGAVGSIAPSSCSGGLELGRTIRSYNPTGRPSNTTYSFRLCAKNANGSLSSGVTLTTRTLKSIPANPTSLTAPSATASSIVLRWVSGGGTTAGFKISKSATGYPAAGCSTGDAVGNVVTSTVTGLTANTLYYFRVCAVNSDGLVSTGSTVSKRTMP